MLIKAAVEWHPNFENSPTFKVQLDHEPEFVYTHKNGLYWAESEGVVAFYAYKSPGDGYGGSKFPIKVYEKDQIVDKTLIGPWSSRAGVMNQYFPHCVEVSACFSDEVWQKGYTFYHGYSLTLPLAIKAANMAGCYLIQEVKGGDINYIPSLSPYAVVKPRTLQEHGFAVYSGNRMLFGELSEAIEYSKSRIGIQPVQQARTYADVDASSEQMCVS